MDKLRKDQNYSRRDILEFSAYGSLLALLPGCKTTYPKPDFRLIKNGIDAHCHVFNASDLPVGQFIQRVALKDYEDTLTLPSDNRESAVGGLASWLTNFLTGGSITAAEEIDALKDGRTIESPPVRTKELEDRRLKNSLETLLIGSQESAEGNTQRRFRKEDSPFLELVIDELQEEKAAAQKDSYTIDELSSGVTESGGSIGRTFQWARLLLKPRSKIVSTMPAICAQSGVNALSIRPSRVDRIHQKVTESSMGLGYGQPFWIVFNRRQGVGRIFSETTGVLHCLDGNESVSCFFYCLTL